MRRKQLIAILIVLGIVTCSAQSRREEESICNGQGSRSVEIADVDARILGFTIGRTSLEDVQAKLGKAMIVRVSRDEESDIAICYVSPVDGRCSPPIPVRWAVGKILLGSLCGHEKQRNHIRTWMI